MKNTGKQGAGVQTRQYISSRATAAATAAAGSQEQGFYYVPGILLSHVLKTGFPETYRSFIAAGNS